MIRILVIMTCHSRRELTLNAIKTTKKAADYAQCKLFWSVTDDGSTDDTSNVVRENCENLILSQGNGKLYWTKGMSNSLIAAKIASVECDYVLWLNDDVSLLEESLFNLLADLQDSKVDLISGHCVQELGSTDISYGGYLRLGKRPTRFASTVPSGSLVPVDTFNGNVVLMRSIVSEKILLRDYSHMYGDLDFGFRAKKNGFSIFSSRQVIGICPRNATDFPWQSNRMNYFARLKVFFGPKGLVLFDHLKFHWSHCGLLSGTFFGLSSYGRSLLKVLFNIK